MSALEGVKGRNAEKKQPISALQQLFADISLFNGTGQVTLTE
jgi:hypothetical protein